MSALSILATLRVSCASGDPRGDGYLQALDDVRKALLADVVPADNASVARDLLLEAMEKGVTPAEFVVAMLGSPLDRTLERSLDGLTRTSERRLLKALRHRDYQRRKDATYSNAPPSETSHAHSCPDYY